MRLHFSLTAIRQIAEIHDYLAERNERSASNVAGAIHAACRRFLEFPSMGRPGKRPGTRCWTLPGQPYVIAYAIDEATGEITILSVFHTRRARTEH